MKDPRLARLARIAPYRRLREVDASIGKLVKDTKKRAQRDEKRYSSFTEAWQQLVPAELLACSRLAGTRGATITVEVDSSAAKYELDRLLRTGLETNLRSLYRGPLSRIRTRLGTPDQSD